MNKNSVFFLFVDTNIQVRSIQSSDKILNNRRCLCVSICSNQTDKNGKEITDNFNGLIEQQ